MKVNGKQKGNSQERKIANLLSEHFKVSTGLDQSFRRNPDSGSFWGATNQSRLQTHDTSKASMGDIICPEGFTYNIECKFYKEPPSFNLLVKQDVKQWDDWVVQAKQDADNSKKKMCLIIKYNRVDEIVILDKLPSGLKESFMYKNYYVMSLEHFLSQPDTEFLPNAQTIIIPETL